MLQVLEFVERRLEVLLTDGGAQPEVVRAVLRERGSNPALAAASVRELQVCDAFKYTAILMLSSCRCICAAAVFDDTVAAQLPQ